MSRRPKPTTPAEMRAHAAELRAYAERLNAQSDRASTNAPGSYITGASGRTRAQNRKTERALELTINNAKKYNAAIAQANVLEANARKLEKGGHEDAAEAKAKEKEARAKEKIREREERQNLKLGTLEDRLFQGNYPGGIVYADRAVERNGDYRRLAFLPWGKLELEFEKDCPQYWRPYIAEQAAKIQAQRGKDYQVSTSGQTVHLGDPDTYPHSHF